MPECDESWVVDLSALSYLAFGLLGLYNAPARSWAYVEFMYLLCVMSVVGLGHHIWPDADAAHAGSIMLPCLMAGDALVYVATSITAPVDPKLQHLFGVFHTESRIGVKTLRQLRENLDKRMLIVSSEGPTAFTRKECDDPRIEFWTFSELLFNITKFAISPKHSLVDSAEEAALAKKYHMNKDQWPKMYHTDPMCRYYNFPVGALVCIDRKFYTPHRYYRRVIAG